MAKRLGSKLTLDTVGNSANPGRRGGTLKRGNPGNKGGKGRVPLAFVQECNDLVDDLVLPKVRRKLQQMTPDDPAWRWCAEYASKYSKSEVKKPLELTGVDGEPIRFTLDIRTPIRPTEVNGRLLSRGEE